VIAAVYSGAGMRPSGDLDILLDPADWTQASQLLAGLRLPVDLDLHRAYPKMPERSWADLYGRSISFAVRGIEVRTLCREDHLRLLVLHFLSHGGWRPLWLIDVRRCADLWGDSLDDALLAAGPPHRVDWIRRVVELSRTIWHSARRPAPELDWLSREVLSRWGSRAGASQGLGEAEGTGAQKRILHWLGDRFRGPVQALFELDLPIETRPSLSSRLAATFRRGGEKLGAPRVWGSVPADPRRADYTFPEASARNLNDP